MRVYEHDAVAMYWTFCIHVQLAKLPQMDVLHISLCAFFLTCYNNNLAYKVVENDKLVKNNDGVYLHRLSSKYNKVFCSHHHKSHKFVTQNLFYFITLK